MPPYPLPQGTLNPPRDDPAHELIRVFKYTSISAVADAVDDFICRPVDRVVFTDTPMSIVLPLSDHSRQLMKAKTDWDDGTLALGYFTGRDRAMAKGAICEIFDDQLEIRSRQKGSCREEVGVLRTYGATAKCPTRILTPDFSWMPWGYSYGEDYPAKRSLVVEVGYPEDETYLAKKIRLWMQETVSYVFVFECDRFKPVVRLQLWEPGHALRTAADAAPVKTGEIVVRKGEGDGEFEVEGATIEIPWVLIAERGGIDSRGDHEKMVITGDAIYNAMNDVWEYLDECRRYRAWRSDSPP